MSPSTLPVFPLRTVVFPGGPLPLRIFEPRYLDMVSTCMRNDHGFVITLALREEDGSDTAVPAAVGTQVRITDFTRLDDGQLGITVDGEQRVRLLKQWQTPAHLWMAEIEALPAETAARVPPDCAVLARLLEALYSELGPPWTERQCDYDDARWVGGRLVEILPLEPEYKQTLLELDDPVERLYRLLPVVREEAGA